MVIKHHYWNFADIGLEIKSNVEYFCAKLYKHE